MYVDRCEPHDAAIKASDRACVTCFATRVGGACGCDLAAPPLFLAPVSEAEDSESSPSPAAPPLGRTVLESFIGSNKQSVDLDDDTRGVDGLGFRVKGVKFKGVGFELCDGVLI